MKFSRLEKLILGLIISIFCLSLAIGGWIIYNTISPILISSPISQQTNSIQITQTTIIQAPSKPTINPKILSKNEINNRICNSNEYTYIESNGDIKITISEIWYANIPNMAQRCEIRDLVIYIYIENLGNKSISVSPFDFSVIDFNGRVHNLDEDSFKNPIVLESTTLLPGTYTSGQLQFGWFYESVPQKIVFQPVLSETIIIDLSIIN